MLVSSKLSNSEIFFCPEESNFYSYCLETLVLKECDRGQSIIEFGSGDGSPVIKALLRTNFEGIIHGFEPNNLAGEAANSKIARAELSHKYVIHNKSFFDSVRPQSDYLVSNPPYLPALDNKLYQPLLHGGIDGITVTKKLLSFGYQNILVMVSSYSNPEELINYAIAQGYYVDNFTVLPLRFGKYSSEPKVRNRMADLRKNNQAFYSENIYLLAGVLFIKQRKHAVDLSTELFKVMTAL